MITVGRVLNHHVVPCLDCVCLHVSCYRFHIRPFSGSQASLGMAYLHEHSPAVVHFDLKPDNLLVDGEGESMVIKVRCLATHCCLQQRVLKVSGCSAMKTCSRSEAPSCQRREVYRDTCGWGKPQVYTDGNLGNLHQSNYCYNHFFDAAMWQCTTTVE